MSELAFNINGEPFEVPPTMAAWRVRRLKPKGAPEVVYGRDGLPLFLPMDADIDDLRREAPTEGRYRLDPVDDHNRTVPSAQASYVCVHSVARPSQPRPQPGSSNPGGGAARCPRARRGRRAGRAHPERCAVQRRLARRAGPGTRSAPERPVKPRRDGRRAAGSTAPLEPPSAMSTAPTGGAPSPGLDMIPTSQAHIEAIQRALTPDENAAVRAHLATLPLAERSAWTEALLALPVEEAVVAIRAQHIADRASAAPADDLIVAATAQPAKEATSAAEAAAVATAEIASIGAGGAALSSRPMSTSTTTHAGSTDGVAPPDEQPAPALAIDAPADAVPTVSAAAPPNAESPSLDAPPSTAPRTVEANADAHLVAIELALTAGERFLVHTTVAQMDPEARELLLDRLLSASVPEGAAILRAAIQDRTTEAPPAETRPQAVAFAGASGPDERQHLDDGETFNTAEEVEAEELGDAGELEIEEIDEEEQPEDGQSDMEPATDGQALADDHTAAAVPSAGLPTLDPEVYRHFMAINAALTFAERMRVFELGARLSPADLRGWITALTALSVPEAAAKVRAALAMADGTAPTAANGNAHPVKKGGVS